MRVTVLVGNPKPQSRTAFVARTLAEKLFTQDTDDLVLIDLADHASESFRWPSERMDRLTQVASECDLLVVASPTYKATYTGLLKAFLDRYPTQGLQGVVAIPVMTGADMGHALGPEVSLRPLLVELGAVVPTQSLYFVTSELERLDDVIREWIEDNVNRLSAHLPRVMETVESLNGGEEGDG